MTKSNNIIGLNLDVDDNYLSQCVEQTVIAGISESLNGKNEIVSQLVHDVLNIKVDRNGRVSGYERDNQYTLLEYHVRHAITETTKEEIAKVIEESKPRIAEAIRDELSKKKTMNDMVACFVKAITYNLTNGWRTSIDINFEVNND